MNNKSGPPPIVFLLLFLALLGGCYWFFFVRRPTSLIANSVISPTNTPTTSSSPFPSPTSVKEGTNVRIDGSTSMVTINQNLKKRFEGHFPSTSVVTTAHGSDPGIQALLANTVDIAAVSRPLSPQEQAQGLVAVPIAKDAITIVVGKTSPFQQGLTSAQVIDIFQGKIKNWSEVGGISRNIEVINRPAISGTYQVFKELVLKAANFGTAPNFKTLQTDGTTILFQTLGTDGIGYTTYAQAAQQQTVRVLAIDGVTPDTSNYPYQRQLYYVYKNPASPSVQSFLGYVSAQGDALGSSLSRIVD